MSDIIPYAKLTLDLNAEGDEISLDNNGNFKVYKAKLNYLETMSTITDEDFNIYYAGNIKFPKDFEDLLYNDCLSKIRNEEIQFSFHDDYSDKDLTIDDFNSHELREMAVIIPRIGDNSNIVIKDVTNLPEKFKTNIENLTIDYEIEFHYKDFEDESYDVILDSVESSYSFNKDNHNELTFEFSKGLIDLINEAVDDYWAFTKTSEKSSYKSFNRVMNMKK